MALPAHPVGYTWTSESFQQLDHCCRALTQPAPQNQRDPKGQGASLEGPAVRRFSQQHLSCWESCTTDPWVVATLSQGYSHQFECQPLVFSGVRLTIVNNTTKSQTGNIYPLEKEDCLCLLKSQTTLPGVSPPPTQP
ncbi:uncharacterized protein AKAME5_001994300 [Lates japonicus]|uniref:Uncharacterized protein n=1 Tax=Lates japonicus TaxID=270547 RepID=A0AAD3NBV3_LATJO|nr:uncharacterized protein AKAME5_001994300 [Lates japonicus]